MDRRQFIKNSALAISAVSSSALSSPTSTPAKKPNIIFIFTDQQHAGMMSCAGNPWLKTPGMDYIAQNGIRFTRAYTTNPVCVPARIGIMSGRFPAFFKDKDGLPARYNESAITIANIPDSAQNTTLADHLKQAGYDLAFGGKMHLPEPLTPSALGVDIISKDERDQLNEAAAGFIRKNHDKPYFLWLNPINPHDICYMALNGLTFKNFKNFKPKKEPEKVLLEAMKLPEGVSEEEFFAKHCPPLPPNFEPAEDEPHTIKRLLELRPFMIEARKNYTEKDWLLHRWAYCRLTEIVDRHVQTVIDAVKESGQEENTLIIFSSDHGDMDASHRMEHKTALYEQSANIPFLAMYKGHIPAGRVDSTHLISNGLDLLPTVCDYAGIEAKADHRGRSLRPLLEDKKIQWRDTLGVESQIGRMVVDKDGCKYIRYDLDAVEEQLHDLSKDPYETRQFIDDPSYARKLASLKTAFNKDWFPQT